MKIRIRKIMDPERLDKPVLWNRNRGSRNFSLAESGRNVFRFRIWIRIQNKLKYIIKKIENEVTTFWEKH
jgi:hypothetical protein